MTRRGLIAFFIVVFTCVLLSFCATTQVHADEWIDPITLTILSSQCISVHTADQWLFTYGKIYHETSSTEWTITTSPITYFEGARDALVCFDTPMVVGDYVNAGAYAYTERMTSIAVYSEWVPYTEYTVYIPEVHR